MSEQANQAAVSTLRKWREHPSLFVRECFGATPDPWQEVALETFPHHQRTAVKANKGPGKSTLDAWTAWNFLVTRPHPKVAATSVSGDNLRDGLWAEMSKWQARAVPMVKQGFTWSAERIWNNQHRETWWMSARTWRKDADASAQADTLAGLHADYLLFIIDEAGSVPDAVVAAAEAALATGIETKLLLTGNPTLTSGPLYRAFTREQKLWHLIEVTGDPDDPKRSPRVSIEWARQQIAKYGREHPWVLVNVFGQFPPTQSNALIGIGEVDESVRRTLHDTQWNFEARVLGIDVARFGDDRSCFFRRQGRATFRPRILRNLDTMELAGQAALEIADFKPHAVFVDVGGVGAGVYDRLRQLGYEMVHPVEFGGKATKTEPKFADKRTEIWWDVAQWIRAGGHVPDDAELRAELTAPTYKFDQAGRLKLESKDELKKRGLASPDVADALALTFALPVPPPDIDTMGRIVERRWETPGHDYNPLQGGA